jgi:hypothetical protein
MAQVTIFGTQPDGLAIFLRLPLTALLLACAHLLLGNASWFERWPYRRSTLLPRGARKRPVSGSHS